MHRHPLKSASPKLSNPPKRPKFKRGKPSARPNDPHLEADDAVHDAVGSLNGFKLGEADIGDVPPDNLTETATIDPANLDRSPGVELSDVAFGLIRDVLIAHLGSPGAADAWLNSTTTGYPTTAADAIAAGHGLLVLEDLKRQRGPAPTYA